AANPDLRCGPESRRRRAANTCDAASIRCSYTPVTSATVPPDMPGTSSAKPMRNPRTKCNGTWMVLRGCRGVEVITSSVRYGPALPTHPVDDVGFEPV